MYRKTTNFGGRWWRGPDQRERQTGDRIMALAIGIFALVSCLGSTTTATPAFRSPGGSVKLISTWYGDMGDVVAGAAVGAAAGFAVGSTLKSSTIKLAEAAYTQAAITMLLSRLRLIKIEWARVRALVAGALQMPLHALHLLVARRADKRRRVKAADIERTNRAARNESSGHMAGRSGRDSLPLFNEHAAVGSLCAFAVGVSLSPPVGVGGRLMDDWRRLRGGGHVPAATHMAGFTRRLAVIKRPRETQFARNARGGVVLAADAGADDEDWVHARIAQEERAFRAKREEARVARASAWEEEARRLRAEEALWAEVPDASEAAAAAGGGPALSEGQAAGRQANPGKGVGEEVAEYEARVREAARPKTEAEKREAYNRDLLAQIEQADAMDERLRAKQREARRRATGRE